MSVVPSKDATMSCRWCAVSDVTVDKPGVRNPTNEPNESFKYIDISSVDNKEKRIIRAKELLGSEAPSRARKVIRTGDVIVSTTRPNLNAVAVVPQVLDNEICSTGYCVLRPTAQVSTDYLFYFVQSCRFVSFVSGGVSGAMYPATTDAKIRAVKIPVPSLEEQRRIVDILKRADSIRRLRKQAQDTALQLIPALFIDMFGDPAINPNSFEERPLKEITDIGSGVTKGRKLDEQETIELPYLAVANVQDGHLNLDRVKSVRIKPPEVEKYQVLPGDFLMTEGGDPDKLGRGAIWSGEIQKCLHQNHIFRVRCNQEILLPEYLRSLVGSHYGKGYFLRVAKQTTGIASINKTQLGNFPVVVPPIEIQKEFMMRLESIQSILRQQEAAQIGAESSFQSLLHRTFNGDA